MREARPTIKRNQSLAEEIANSVSHGIGLFAILLAVGLRAVMPARWLGTRGPALATALVLLGLDLFVLVDSFLPAYVWRTFA